MINFKKTKIIYTEKDSEGKEILVDAVINMENVTAIFPGIKPGQLVLLCGEKTKYTVKDSLDNLLDFKPKKEKK